MLAAFQANIGPSEDQYRVRRFRPNGNQEKELCVWKQYNLRAILASLPKLSFFLSYISFSFFLRKRKRGKKMTVEMAESPTGVDTSGPLAVDFIASND